MLEKQLEQKFRNSLKKLGALCWKFTSPGTRGVPDRIVVWPTGQIDFVELKSNGRLSKIQQFRLKQLTERNAWAGVIDGEEEMERYLEMRSDVHGI